jgi:hypothetical protein
MSTVKTDDRRVITPIARLSYPALFKPSKALEGGGEGKYQCELIFDPGVDISALKNAANIAAKEKWGDKIPKGLRTPFRDGDKDREDKDGYAGNIFIGARSKDRPGVIIGRERLPCTDESEVYGGCYVRASVTAFAYDTNGNRGVSFALNNVWKIRDGEPFGNRRDAGTEFGGVQVDADAFGDSNDDSLL